MALTKVTFAMNNSAPVSAFDYMTAAQIADVQAGSLTLDVSTAINNALAAATDEVYLPDGQYRVDSSIEVPAYKTLTLSPDAYLIRVAAAANTTPVVYVLGIQAQFRGGNVTTQKASPNGIVVLGAKDGYDNRNAWWWRFMNCTVRGLNTASNAAVVVPSGQAFHPVANYFGTIENINIYGADVGLQFEEYANAHNVANIQYWDCRTACLKLRGAYANNIVNQFMHNGAASGVIGVWIANKTVGTQESSLNNIINWTDETANSGDVALVIDSNCTKNTVIGNDNVSGGFSIGNADNFVMLRGLIRSCSDATFANTTVTGKANVKNTASGTRDSFDESNNTISSVSAGGVLTLKTVVKSGFLVIRNASDGGSAIVLIDSVAGATVVSDPGSLIAVGADPGAGSSKFWVVAGGASTTITNRYSAPKQIDVRTVAAN